MKPIEAQPSPSGLSQLLGVLRPELLRFLAARLGDAGEAEDILQELWIRVRDGAGGPVGNGRAYLYRAAQNLALDVRVIKPRGTIAIYANNGGDEVTLSVRATFSTNARFQWVLLYTVGDQALRAAADDITAAVADGAFGVGDDHGLPVHHFPLEETAAAHAAVEDGAVGKVLIDVAEA